MKMSKIKSRMSAVCIAGLLTGLTAWTSPALARVTLEQLMSQIDALQAQMDNLTSHPCPQGQAVTGVDADGTPVCHKFTLAAASFSNDFIQGTAGITQAVTEACPAWQNWLAEAAGGGYSSLTVSGSAGTSRSCSDPTKVTQIIDALTTAQAGPVVGGVSATIACDGFNWSVSNFCASTANGGPGTPQAELLVSPDTDPVPFGCQCLAASENVYSVRPCIGNHNWGGVGTDLCNAPSQTISVQAK